MDCLNLQDTPALKFEIHTRRKLIQILPSMQTDEGMSLNAAQWQQLYKVLRGDDERLIVATLKALKTAGNSDALLPVQAIAEGKIPSVKTKRYAFLRGNVCPCWKNGPRKRKTFPRCFAP